MCQPLGKPLNPLRGIQSGDRRYPLRLLGPCQTEMAGSDAGRRNGENQQGISVLQQAVLSGEKECLYRPKRKKSIPPEHDFAGSERVFFMAENHTLRKGSKLETLMPWHPEVQQQYNQMPQLETQ